MKRLLVDPLTKHQRVAGILSFPGIRKAQSLRQFGRHVLHAVDSQIGFTIQQAFLDLSDKDALSAQRMQRSMLVAVARGAHDHQLTARRWIQ